jgi:hypothetical protein
MPRRHGHRLGAALDAQLVEDGGEMAIDGAGGDEELPADRFAREPLGYQAQHLQLALAEQALE